MKNTAVLVPTILLFALSLYAQQPATQSPAEHHAGVTSRGDQAMGFSHEKTTHHFRLFKDGGAIEVEANDPKDSDSRDMVRMHLAHIAKMFAVGDFNAPMFIHDTNPPGVPTMTELRDQIQYQFEKTDSGGRVRIQTANAKALEAIHEFLRFQIKEHQTGDSPDVKDVDRPQGSGAR
jgi:hypothetical protein